MKRSVLNRDLMKSIEFVVEVPVSKKASEVHCILAAVARTFVNKIQPRRLYICWFTGSQTKVSSLVGGRYSFEVANILSLWADFVVGYSQRRLSVCGSIWPPLINVQQNILWRSIDVAIKLTVSAILLVSGYRNFPRSLLRTAIGPVITVVLVVPTCLSLWSFCSKRTIPRKTNPFRSTSPRNLYRMLQRYAPTASLMGVRFFVLWAKAIFAGYETSTILH